MYRESSEGEGDGVRRQEKEGEILRATYKDKMESLNIHGRLERE
jgi:hypothetical protein